MKLENFTVYIITEHNNIKKLYKFVIRGESIKDIEDYVNTDYIPNEIKKGNTSILPHKNTTYTIHKIFKGSDTLQIPYRGLIID